MTTTKAFSAGPAAMTVGDACVAGLVQIGRNLGLTHDPEVLDELVSDVLGPASQLELGSPLPRTDLSDDGSPFEYSVALSPQGQELRVLVEVHGQSDSLLAHWRAGLEATGRLADRWGASLVRFQRIAPLFEPRHKDATFAIWHALCLRGEGQPLVKIYLDPSAAGPQLAHRTVAEAMSELGMEAGWRRIADVLSRERNLRLIFFSLDLAEASEARVKVYLAHQCSTAEQFGKVLDGAGVASSQAVEFCRAMTGGNGPYADRPLQSCFNFTSNDPGSPTQVTTYVPIRSYVWDDEIALQRLLAYLPFETHGRVKGAIDAVAKRPLAAGRGLIAYASMSVREGQQTQGPRFTVYLSAELGAVTPPIKNRMLVD